MLTAPDQLTLQERVRRFNLGTPTALHVGTHELVNDIWRTHVEMLAALIEAEKEVQQSKTDAAAAAPKLLAALRDMLKHHGNPPNLPEVIKAHRAIAKATGAA